MDVVWRHLLEVSSFLSFSGICPRLQTWACPKFAEVPEQIKSLSSLVSLDVPLFLQGWKEMVTFLI